MSLLSEAKEKPITTDSLNVKAQTTAVTQTTQVVNLTVLILGLTLVLSFSSMLWLNLVIIGCCFGVLVVRKHFASLLTLLVLPILPAVSAGWAVIMQGNPESTAFVLASRCFAFAGLGLVFAMGVSFEELLLYLEQQGLPQNFVYGILVVVQGISEMLREVKNMREAALLKGQRLSFWSPLLYMKTLLVAVRWREQYQEALLAHGYDEEGPRSCFIHYRSSLRGLVVVILILVLAVFAAK